MCSICYYRLLHVSRFGLEVVTLLGVQVVIFLASQYHKSLELTLGCLHKPTCSKLQALGISKQPTWVLKSALLAVGMVCRWLKFAEPGAAPKTMRRSRLAPNAGGCIDSCRRLPFAHSCPVSSCSMMLPLTSCAFAVPPTWQTRQSLSWPRVASVACWKAWAGGLSLLLTMA